MKIACTAFVAALSLASFAFAAGCSSPDDSTSDQGRASTEGLSSDPTSAAGDPKATTSSTDGVAKKPATSSATPTSATGGSGKPSTSAACGLHEKICEVADATGSCHKVCVMDTALCVAPSCKPVCDPVGGAPRSSCHWDLSACEWSCPVCDPTPKPLPGCSWDAKACVWLCL